jgi:hypothetical protein
MKNKTNTIQTESQKRINQAINVYKAFNKNFFWLDAMVKSGELSSSEAGYILTYIK